MKLFGFDRVLCLSPHPDDVELSMSGTIMKFRDTHFTVLTMSNGSKGDRYAGPERLEEVRLFWDTVRHSFYPRNTTVEFEEDVEFIGDISEEEWIQRIDAKAGDYDAIFVPPLEDSHYEHRLVHLIGLACCRNHPISLVSYAPPSALNRWVPTVLVDIGAELERKRNGLLGGFPSQSHRSYFQGAAFDTFHRNAQAGKKGVLYAERFRVEEVYR